MKEMDDLKGAHNKVRPSSFQEGTSIPLYDFILL
jgi:hypothetical protein